MAWQTRNEGSWQTPSDSTWQQTSDADWQAKRDYLQSSFTEYAYGLGRYGMGKYGIGEGLTTVTVGGEIWQVKDEQEDLTSKTQILWQQQADGSVITAKIHVDWQSKSYTRDDSYTYGWGQDGWGNSGGWGGGGVTITVDITQWMTDNRKSFATEPQTVDFMERA